MIEQYNSVYAKHIQEFIDMKRELGFRFIEGAIFLSKIDELASKRRETSQGITQEFANQWTEKRPHECAGFQYKRVSHLVQFSIYLCGLGIKSYIPKMPPTPKSTFIPHIYSQKEMDALFKASDEAMANLLLKKSCIICFPALIRLLYSTGLRINEALALKNEDINLVENYLRLKDGKNGKERIIPISNTLADVLKNHIHYRDKIPIEKTKSDHFFVRLDGNTFRKEVVGKWFRKCLIKAGIPYIGRTQGPRLHDLRHTFAVTSLANMARSGIDLYVSLPILSCYMGHQSLESTNNYVRLTANMYPDLIKDIDTICLDVFPKSNYYEAN